MSNEYVIASAQFLKESWYRENAGTPKIQEAKLLDKIFEEIVDYLIGIGANLEESIDIANEIIEDDLIEEFYEEFLNERWTSEGPTGPNPNATPYGASGTVNTPVSRARVAAQKANQELRRQLAVRDAQPTTPKRTTPTTASAPRVSPRPTQTQRPATSQGPLTVGGQGVATNTGSASREPQAPINTKRPIIRSIFKNPSNPLE